MAHELDPITLVINIYNESDDSITRVIRMLTEPMTHNSLSHEYRRQVWGSGGGGPPWFCTKVYYVYGNGTNIWLFQNLVPILVSHQVMTR